MKKIFYIALTAVLGLAGTSCDREKLTYDSEPGEISGKNRNPRSFFFRCHTQ